LDAPLDESNINRFIRVLQWFLAHRTQNRECEFHKTDEAVTDHKPISLETPTIVLEQMAPACPSRRKGMQFFSFPLDAPVDFA